MEAAGQELVQRRSTDCHTGPRQFGEVELQVAASSLGWTHERMDLDTPGAGMVTWSVRGVHSA